MRAGHPPIQTFHPVAPDVVHVAPFLLGSTCCPGAVASSTTALHTPRCSASAPRGSHSCPPRGPRRAGQPTSLRRVPWQVSEKAINRTRRPPQGPSEPDLWRLPEPAGPTHATRNPGRDQQPGTPYMRRRRLVLPEDASSGLTPHRSAKEASLRSRSGLSPAAMSSAAALSGPVPRRGSQGGGGVGVGGGEWGFSSRI